MDELSKQDLREAAQDLAAEGAASESGAAGEMPRESRLGSRDLVAEGAVSERPAGSGYEAAGGGADDGGGEYDGVPIATFGFLDHLRPDFWD